MKKIKVLSLKWRMIGIFLVCWMFPVILLIGLMGYYIFSHHNESTAENMTEQLAYNDQICMERLNNIVTASRAASYDNTIKGAYYQYKEGTVSYNELYTATNDFLVRQYWKDDCYLSVIFWFADSPETMNCAVYNQSAEGKYSQIQEYWNSDHEQIKRLADGLDTAIGFYESGGRIYMVRNIMNPSYQSVGTLVMRLNIQYCFGSILNIPWSSSVVLYLNDQPVLLKGDNVDAEMAGVDLSYSHNGYLFDKSTLYVYHSVLGNSYRLAVLAEVDSSAVLGPFYGYQYVLIGMVLSLVPLLLLVLRIFQKHISKPVQVMMKGAKEIESGNLGYQIGCCPDNREFKYLTESLNHMSERLKYQFDHIYEEELALRDARIMALQSHINPHFLNNTLEIINWEARLSGCMKVSKMIEALSILLDAAMDRKKKPEVRFSEEMIYVNAYLYIVSERLGKRLTVIKELDEEIMGCYVPRLILQPVIENAIEHGVMPNNYGTVVIRGKIKEELLILEVENDGTLTSEDEAHIARLLDPEYDTSKEPSGSLGIANVNQRLRILYGPPSGLSIWKNDDNHIIARMMISVGKNEQKNTINNRLSYSFSSQNKS